MTIFNINLCGYNSCTFLSQIEIRYFHHYHSPSNVVMHRSPRDEYTVILKTTKGDFSFRIWEGYRHEHDGNIILRQACLPDHFDYSLTTPRVTCNYFDLDSDEDDLENIVLDAFLDLLRQMTGDEELDFVYARR